MQARQDEQMHSNFEEGKNGLKAVHPQPSSLESPHSFMAVHRSDGSSRLEPHSPATLPPQGSPSSQADPAPPVMAAAPRPPHVTSPAGEGGGRRRRRREQERSRGVTARERCAPLPPPRARGGRRGDAAAAPVSAGQPRCVCAGGVAAAAPAPGL